MREIKCKAFDKVNKKWIGDNFLEFLCVCEDVVVLVTYAPNGKGGYSPKSVRHLTHPEVSNLEIVQFTGLLDKNGKEIYEGDVIKDGYHGISKVFYRNGGYKINGYHSVVGFGSFARKTKVIGNIYENPELLEMG